MRRVMIGLFTLALTSMSAFSAEVITNQDSSEEVKKDCDVQYRPQVSFAYLDEDDESFVPVNLRALEEARCELSADAGV